MNEEVKKMVINALRSGEYKKIEGMLCSDGGFCFYGVLCDLHAKAIGGEWEFDTSAPPGGGYRKYLKHVITPPIAVLQWAGLPQLVSAEVSINGVRLSIEAHNDFGRTFAEIADAIEEQL